MKNVLIVGAVIVLALAAFFFFTGEEGILDGVDTENDMEENENLDDVNDGVNGNGGATGPQNSVVLAESETGNFATVGSVTLAQPGFVAIYKVNSNGDTTLIGNTNLLAAGTHGNIQVQLDTIIAREEIIVATLHEDDGDSEFEYPESDAHLGNEGNAFVSDVDVVDVALEDENEELQEQVELYIEQNSTIEMSEDLEVN